MKRLAAAVLLSSLAVFGAAACKKKGTDWRILQLYSGETSVALLRSPAKVQAFRLAPLGAPPNPGDVHAGPYVASAAPVDVPADAAAELSTILADPDTYDWQRGAKRDGFRPQVGLWFVRGAYVLEIALDLDSAQLGVYAGDQPLGVVSCDTAKDRFAAIAKRVLPDDAAAGTPK
jgi:hypothetical protein